ncbi:murein DD-endopeptidase MepM/ murein hydrolase activator NlpD [Actimicrobium sp. GrIS 1.19]|nr:murein DD-endopeptidase MepM/ murein hydrolase activator NlpD [Actimicrobium sp. GrIS 1.19]
MFNSDKFRQIRTSSKLLLGSSRKTRIISASALFLAICAFGAAGVAPMAPDAADLPVKSIAVEMALPDLASQIAALEENTQHYVHEENVRPGDTLAAVLQRLGVDDDAAEAFIKSDKVARSVLQLKPGKRIQAQTSDDGELQWLSSMQIDGRDADGVRNVVINRVGDQFKASEVPAKLERRVEMHAGEIRSSLFAATDAAQIPDNVAKQIVEMFATDIDFASDLQRGDRFDVVYETFWQNGEFVRAGRILAGEFRNGGNTFKSVWFDEPSASQGGGYYSFDGKSLKKAFLKSPLEFSRISSGFSMRVHPISGQWKQHKGVDFAAAVGTPVRASADGVVEFSGNQGGYGNVVVLKHWSNLSTAYAHMSRFATGMHKGEKVSQGDVIGYVGTTGWSTGPHLHYEFRVNNAPRDPMSVDVPNAQPLAGAELQRFRNVAGDMSHRFALLSLADKGPKLAMK